MKGTSVVIGFLLIIFLSIPVQTSGQDITLVKEILIDPNAKFKSTPTSFCVTEEGQFILPDYKTSTVKVLNRNGELLKSINTFKCKGANEEKLNQLLKAIRTFIYKGACREKFNQLLKPIQEIISNGHEERFVQPRYCFECPSQRKLGIIDSGKRKLFLFTKNENQTDFTCAKEVKQDKIAYDISLWKDLQLVVSGFITDQNNMPFDLYSKNLDTGQIDYLLESHQKYNLENHRNYKDMYRQKLTLPAIGIKAYIDIHKDDLYFVWEGALRILKIDLKTKEITSFGHETFHYKMPNGYELASSYKKGDYRTTWKAQEKYAYIKDIFASDSQVFLVYQAGKNETGSSELRLQIYTIKGEFQADVLITGDPDTPVTIDKKRLLLYTFSKKLKKNDGKFSILKYNINIWSKKIR